MTEMFCYQCEQTAHGTGCTSLGVCGKTPETATLQDVMIYIVKGISQYACRSRKLGAADRDVDETTLEALFMTLTNVNFDFDEHVQYVNDKLTPALNKARSTYLSTCAKAGLAPDRLNGPAEWTGVKTGAELEQFGKALSIFDKFKMSAPDVVSLQELLTYGLKGLAAYAHHAQLLGYRDDRIYEFTHKAFDYLTMADQTTEELLSLCLKAGEVNFFVMQLLDQSHCETFGDPQPSTVRITPVKGKAILISGHDMKSLHELLKQTEGLGVNVYTHGETLPAHGYPELKKFKHLVGNYGTAWQNQIKEFSEFPGSIVMTTNCLKPPANDYKHRLFSMDVVGYDGVQKIHNYDFSAAVKSALSEPGFEHDVDGKEVTVGFGHNAVLGISQQIVDAVKSGAIKHFFLVGGCDGAETSRSYFTDFAEAVPSDAVVMTLGCGKYRFNFHDFGDINGIPRLVDLGQCNDAYSAIRIASALAEAFECGVNDLPLSLVLSWFEQKAVAVLLTLLSLGIKNIRLGPNLPAFVTPGVLQILQDAYGLQPIGDPLADVESIVGPISSTIK